MLHEPAAQSGKDHAANYKMRLGVWMFIPYALFYGGFVAINVVKPVLMERIVFLGLPLSVVYGFGLIIVALILAFIYNAACSKKEAEFDAKSAHGEDA
jgi:uncharacterized membrane protein (DUF485 family)